MSARDDLIHYAASTRTVTADGLAPYIERVEKEADAIAYQRAIEAARSERLRDGTGTSDDEAYNQGVTDAIAAIEALSGEIGASIRPPNPAPAA